MFFLRQAKIPGHLEDHIMAKTNGSRNFSDLLDAIQILARRPMSQVSSSFPSYYDEWDDSTNATEYHDIDDHDAVDNDGYYDDYDEPEDYDGEWIDMSGIPEDATFEGLELACLLESLQKGKKRDRARVSGEARKAGARVSPVIFCNSQPRKLARAVVLKTTNRFDRSCRAIVLTKAGETSQLMDGTKDVVAHSWLRWMISSLAPVVSNVESWSISRRTARRTRNRTHIPRLSSVVWLTTTPALFILETTFVLVSKRLCWLVFLETIVLVFLKPILVLVTLETNPVLTMTLETNPVRMLILVTGCVLKLTFKEMMKPSSVFEKMM